MTSTTSILISITTVITVIVFVAFIVFSIRIIAITICGGGGGGSRRRSSSTNRRSSSNNRKTSKCLTRTLPHVAVMVRTEVVLNESYTTSICMKITRQKNGNP